MDDNELFDKWLAENTPRDRAYSLTDLRHGFMAALALQREQKFKPYAIEVSNTESEAALLKALSYWLATREHKTPMFRILDDFRASILKHAREEGRYVGL